MPAFWLLKALAICFASLQICLIFTSVYFHRGMAHNSLKFHPGAAFLMRFSLWCLAAQAMRAWVAVHRKHHQFSDVEGDPHSPYLIGTWRLFWNHEKHYLKAANDPTLLAQYTRGIPLSKADWFLENSWLGMATGAGMFTLGFGLWFGPWGFLVGIVAYYLQFYCYLKGGALINTVCHMFGYRNFKDEKATNFPGLDLFVGGEGLHNNHHHDMTSPRLSLKWWEIDPGWWLISTLRLCGLATLKCRALKEKTESKEIVHSPQ